MVKIGYNEKSKTLFSCSLIQVIRSIRKGVPKILLFINMFRYEKSYLFLIDSICPSLAFTIIFLKLIFSDSGEIIADPKGPRSPMFWVFPLSN